MRRGNSRGDCMSCDCAMVVQGLEVAYLKKTNAESFQLSSVLSQA